VGQDSSPRHTIYSLKRDPAYPGVWQALILLGLYYAAGTGPLLLLYRLFGISMPWLAFGTIAVVMPLSVAMVLWYGYRRTGLPLSTVFPMRALPAPQMAGILALVVGFRFVGGGHEASTASAIVRFMEIVVVAVYAPVSEELLYRGLILRGFRERYGNTTALLGSSALFAMAHFHLGWQALGPATSGLFFGYLYLQTQTLLPCLLVHSVWNATFILTPENSPELWAWLRNPQRLVQPAHIQAIGFGLLVFGGLILVLSQRPAWKMKEAERSLVKSAQALSAQALKSDEKEAAGFLEQAYAHFERLENLNPQHEQGLRIWALTLIADSARKPPQEAERLLLDAQTKLSAALEAAPNAADLIVTKALALHARARLRPKEDAVPLLAEGRALVEKVLASQPYDAYALSTWAYLLCSQAGAGSGMDSTLVEACERMEAAGDMPSRDQLLDAWGALLLARADRASGDEAVGHLRAAREKFAEMHSHHSDYGTYNIAQVCARLGEIDECRLWLERGHEPGRQVGREEMAADTDFESVRGCDWFQRRVGSDTTLHLPSSELAE
jgi:membrane protease YdiL (CAAX protease family)